MQSITQLTKQIQDLRGVVTNLSKFIAQTYARNSTTAQIEQDLSNLQNETLARLEIIEKKLRNISVPEEENALISSSELETIREAYGSVVGASTKMNEFMTNTAARLQSVKTGLESQVTALESRTESLETELKTAHFDFSDDLTYVRDSFPSISARLRDLQDKFDAVMAKGVALIGTEFPEDDPLQGTFFVRTDMDNKLFVFDGSAWVEPT